jgi:hypothetical protein
MKSSVMDDKVGSIDRIDTSDVSHEKDFHIEEEDQQLDEAYKRKEKRLVRKLDMTLMPVVWILYLFNYLDRNNIA